MKRLAPLCLAASLALSTAADELSLPPLLTRENGTTVTTPAEWRDGRRPEILEQFRSQVYGRAPIGRPQDLRFEVTDTTTNAMDGQATRKLVKIHFTGPGGTGAIALTVFIPNKRTAPAPGFLLICNRPVENIDPTREKKSPFWPAEQIVARGYAAAAFLNSDLDPDKNDGFKDGVHGIFDPPGAPRPADAWATIAAWAWGASRVMDYFETDPDIDAGRIAVIGHSRGGKTALWCGAEDPRFALVISNDSGCTGAALARRKVGETVAVINKHFPHWFCTNYKQYNDNEDKLPVDQHQLIALIAPRPVYVASASLDAWADPEGEFLSCVYAAPAYRLFGLEGLGTAEMPKPDSPIQAGYIGYHIRTGKHDLTEYDWSCYMDFADRRLKTVVP